MVEANDSSRGQGIYFTYDVTLFWSFFIFPLPLNIHCFQLVMILTLERPDFKSRSNVFLSSMASPTNYLAFFYSNDQLGAQASAHTHAHSQIKNK